MELDALAIGICTVDLIASVPRFPQPDGNMTMGEFATSIGGIAAVAGIAAARLGARVGFAGAIGDDGLGHTVQAALSSDGVDTSLLEIVAAAPTSSCLVISDQHEGTRSILNHPCIDSYGLRARHDVRQRSIHLDHTAFHGLAQDSLPACRQAGVQVSVDAGVEPPGMRAYLSHIDVFASTERQILAMTGYDDLTQAMRAVRAAGPRVVVATLGARGSAALTDGGRLVTTPAFAVPVVDTTGAGDVFHGALLYALLRQMDLEQALLFSNAAAALSCRAKGGRAGCPTLADVHALLAANGATLSSG